MFHTEKIISIMKANATREFTAKELEGLIGLPRNNISSLLLAKYRTGCLGRRVFGRTATNNPKYTYWYIQDVPQRKRGAKGKKKPDTLANVPEQNSTGLEHVVREFVDSFANVLADTIATALKPRLEERLTDIRDTLTRMYVELEQGA